jgi:acyl-CoA reductase-like NAD-dependent aldehyde dehydrogenase
MWAAGTADGAFYNNGQSCCSVERIYVHEKVYDAYVNAFVEEVKSWQCGLPTEAGVYIAALTRQEQIAVLEEQIADAVAKGATVVAGGKRKEGKGYFFKPTVITNVTNEMKVMRDESFGPIIGIAKVRNDAEAISLMNDTEYGLTSAVYTSDKARAESILSQLNSGTAYWKLLR